MSDEMILTEEDKQMGMELIDWFKETSEKIGAVKALIMLKVAYKTILEIAKE